MSDPMPAIIDTLRGAAVLRKAEVTVMDPRAALVDLFEKYAERGNDDQLYIDIETAADLVVDNYWEQFSAVAE